MKSRGLRYLADHDLPPGRYQMRIAARTSASSGSVFWDVEVAGLKEGHGVLSDPIVTSVRADDMPTVSDTPRAALEAGLMTPIRAFDNGDTLTLAAVARATSAATASAAIVVRRADGTEVVRESNVEAVPGAARDRARYLARLPLRSLAPGRYVVTLEVVRGDRMDATRGVAIEVR